MSGFNMKHFIVNEMKKRADFVSGIYFGSISQTDRLPHIPRSI